MDRRIRTVISRIEREPSVRFAELAAMINLSHSRLRHLFKKETGVTYKQYVKQFRLRKAEMLLRTTFLSVKEIMVRIGLVDNGHFAHDFKKMFGDTPTTYRSKRQVNGKNR